MKIIFLLAFVNLILFSQHQATAQYKNDESKSLESRDHHTFVRPGQVLASHLDLDIKVDFGEQKINGKAVWTIDNTIKADYIIFDNNDLDIQKVTLDDEEKPTRFLLGRKVKFLGCPLKIYIQPDTKKINIYYATTKTAIALQWLKPQQTTDKKRPLLFTQSWSIWARTWVPCQDAPGIRFTWSATVSTPKDLMAVMSAEGTQQKNADGIYHFKQTHPVPAYLMALAVGDLQFKAIDERTGVYAEPSMIPKAAWEFSDMGKMVDVAENLYGQYQWGRYDVLILPPSFPLGGMENPNLVFLTPGAITGDRSLVSLVAHELAHSWSGNLVTNATWDDFWLNEGITTYFEHRIGEVLYGKEEENMQTVMSRKRLFQSIATLGKTNADTHLKLKLINRNPDDALTNIPYDKGFAFLQTIEHTVGRKNLDIFLKNYFNEHAFQAHTTEQFLKALNKDLLANNVLLQNELREKEWIYGSGIPINIPKCESDKFKIIDTLINNWRKTGNTSGLNQKIKSANERLYFINNLPKNLTSKKMADLDKEFDFTHSGNYQINIVWFAQAAEKQYQPAYNTMEQFMITKGPGSIAIYKTLSKTRKSKALAKLIYAKARSNYHLTTTAIIDKILQ